MDKRILYLSEAYHGSCHDFAMLKEEFNPKQQNWFKQKEVWLDLGFLGFQKLYPTKVHIPMKKGRRKQLTEEQKLSNQSVSKIRVKIEHSIGGMKRYRILADRLRIRCMIKFNQIAGICAGLWNFILTN